LSDIVNYNNQIIFDIISLSMSIINFYGGANMGAVLSSITRNVGTTSQKLLDANILRKFFLIQNKHASQTVRLKFGAALNSAAVAVQKLEFSAVPTAGTYKIKWNGVKTTALAYNADANAVQTAVRLLTGLGSVGVSGDYSSGLVFTMTSVYPNTTGNPALLEITDSTLEVGTETEIQKISFASVPTNGQYKINYGAQKTGYLQFNDNAGTIETALRQLTGLSQVTVAGDTTVGLTVTFLGVTGDVSMLTISDNNLNIPAVIEKQTITVSVTPTNGTYKIRYGLLETDAIAFDANAGTVQTELQKLAGLGSVTVAGSWATCFEVTFIGVAGNLSLMTIVSNGLNTPAVIETQTLTFEAVPTAGAFKLTFGLETTISLNYNATNTQIRDALRALTGLSSVGVTGTMATALTVTFTGYSGDAALLEITDNTLSIPAVIEQQTVTFSNTPTNGSFELNYNGDVTAAINWNDDLATIQGKVQSLTGLESATVAGSFGAGLVITMTGVAGDANLMTITNNSLNIAAVIETQTITVASIPTNGSYKLNYGGEATGALAFDADAAAVQLALRALTGLGGVTVAGSWATQFTVTFTGVAGDVALLTVSNNSLNIPATIETQLIEFSAVPDAGSCRFSYGGVNSTMINENATNLIVQAALRTIPALSAVGVAGSFAAGFGVTMTGVPGDASMLIEAESDLENTGTPITTTITETLKGVAIVNVTPIVAELLKGVANAATTPTVTETLKGVAENPGITITPLETLKGIAQVNITPVVEESRTGKAIENITPTVAENTPGEAETVTTEIAATTDGAIADGITLAAGAILDLSGSNCPTDDVYALASGELTPIELAYC
jgi:hypothetical protein